MSVFVVLYICHIFSQEQQLPQFSPHWNRMQCGTVIPTRASDPLVTVVPSNPRCCNVPICPERENVYQSIRGKCVHLLHEMFIALIRQ